MTYAEHGHFEPSVIKLEERRLAGRLARFIPGPGFWFVAVVIALITLEYYGDVLDYPDFLANLKADLGLSRRSFERILYLAPMLWSGFLFSRRGTSITCFAALAVMLPRVIFISAYFRDALFETAAVVIVGYLTSLSILSLRKEREGRIYLAALNQTSSVVSESLELAQVLNSSVDSVMEVMKVDAVLVFLLNEETGELTLTAYRGVSEEFVQGVGRMKLGEGFNGRVAATEQPLYVEDASKDPSLTSMPVKEEWIQSQLIVPLKSKGRVMGTLCVAMRSHREFRQDEVELLTAIGNQIGLAVEKASLYELERKVTQQLRLSEERYRKLFESAHDGIWLHDLEGKIIAANMACVGLTGYSLGELHQLRATQLLSGSSVEIARATEQRLLNGQASGSVSEVKLIRKDGTEVFAQLATSLVSSDGQPSAFQCIARDVTEEKRMQENLRFHLAQVTRAQEEERTRIARELHDETIQAMVILSRKLDDLASSGKVSKGERLHLEELRQETNNIMEGVRRLGQDLRPATLDRLGMLPALESLVSDMSANTGIVANVQVLGTQRRLPQEAELLLFRIAQEALRNVWRHSQATNAELIVEFDQRKTRIAVRDNGRGFDLLETMGDLVKDGRLGLAGMRERIQLLGGSLKLESKPGKGTTVTIEAPV